MLDIIGVLNQKKVKLNRSKCQIKIETEHRISEIDNEIKDIDHALTILNSAIKDYLCDACGGKGTIRRADAAGQTEDWECEVCKGTGVKLIERTI